MIKRANFKRKAEMKKINNVTVMTPEDYRAADFDWGRLTWFTSADIGNSDSLTTGKCEINPGCQNPMHSHPNCSEVLHVLQGAISHTISDGECVQMNPGDTISIPPNIAHNAKNTGNTKAVLFICFSSPERITKPE